MRKIKTEISLEEFERYKRNPERFNDEEIEVLTTCLEANIMVPIGMNCSNPKCVNCRNYEEVNYK
jgi:hypothetical protein